ncbi:MAG: ATP--cob(I)alamin adenosyltransferase, partial [Acetivibrio sp.]
DEIASQIGLLHEKVKNKTICQDLLILCELVYHMNPSLRTFVSITQEEKEWLVNKTLQLKEEVSNRCEKFVLTQGCEAACYAHLLRVQGKSLVRFLYRYMEKGNPVDPILIDFANLISQYFFYLALKLNKMEKREEIPYISRNYK